MKCNFLLKLVVLSVSVTVSLFFTPTEVQGSNLQVTGTSIAPLIDASKKGAKIQFDLSWDNSFRIADGAANYDAAWVFVKYRVKAPAGDGLWHTLYINNSDFVAPEGAAISVAADGLGANVYRSNTSVAAGKNLFKSVQLDCNFTKSGIAEGATPEVKVFALEMVYVPTGAFYVATGAEPAEISSFTAANSMSGAAVPFQIGAKPPYVQGNNLKSNPASLSARSLWDLTLSSKDSLAVGYPTGYNGFYCMKYEVSQQEYIDFLNTLTVAQQATRTLNAPTSSAGSLAMTTPDKVFRNGVAIVTPATANTPAVYGYKGSKLVAANTVPCNFLSWADLAAFLDWSGLRPMTELEFEKACRGTATPVANEYAWGSTLIVQNTGVLTSSKDKKGAANCTYGNNPAVQGPLRIVASDAIPANRVANGATFYGIFDMSGNVYERTVTVGNRAGRYFNGSHGDGNLNANGDANTPTWPGVDSYGSGFRGGCWYSSTQYLRVSDRSSAPYASAHRLNTFGGRGVRTAQ